ncbi:MAG: hypothetical protein HON90_14370 [Halobacteriovoraceae bacterium]|nr:hypothetical protein [Halobacteriovoraceae bacterium]
MTPTVSLASISNEDIFLAKGEQIELSTDKLKNFSVGNKEVLKYKFLPKKKKILVKGKGIGFSDLVIWSQNSKKTIYHFYITSKKEQLKKMEIAQILRHSSLKIKIAGNIIYVSGKVKKLKNYLLLRKLEKMKYNNLILNASLDQNLKNEIISNIYKTLYKNDFQFISCTVNSLQITCNYSTKTSHLDALKKFQKTYQVSFININSKKAFNNYELEFRIISVESNNLSSKNSGIDQFETELQDLIQHKQINLHTNSILLKDNHIQAKLIASPKLNTVLDKKFNIEIGGEIPFRSKTEDREIMEWKFIGLKITGKLSFTHHNLLLAYKSLLTKGSQAGINGPKSESSQYIREGNFNLLYSINLASQESQEVSIPVLNSIPILRHLFMSSTKTFIKRKILVYTRLKEVTQ